MVKQKGFPRGRNGNEPKRVLLLFVDGLGLPPGNLTASIYGDCPTLFGLLQDHAAPVDACLGVDGVPQSATGQTTILTGRNAAKFLGQHLSGFPNAGLRELIEKENIFTKLLAASVPCAFANAYVRYPGAQMPLYMRSVTTVATLAAFGATRNRPELLRGEAVYHDLTRRTLAGDPECGDVPPPITEDEAAEHLLAVFRTVRFCLFEYFLTDIAGHRGAAADKRAVLTSLDRFLTHVVAGIDTPRELLLLVSDHGNIESEGNTDHSLNPVPLVAYGAGADAFLNNCRDLTAVTPCILDLFRDRQRTENDH